jgi:hypothetical protein
MAMPAQNTVAITTATMIVKLFFIAFSPFVIFVLDSPAVSSGKAFAIPVQWQSVGSDGHAHQHRR